MRQNAYKIAQISDLHCGDFRFDKKLLTKAIKEINYENPDLLVVAGDLTIDGYREQFEEAKYYIDKMLCQQKIIIAGNHDCRNVGYIYFEKIFGQRYSDMELDFDVSRKGKTQEKIRLVAVDSNKPDLNDGEVGREKYKFISEGFKRKDYFNVFILHHHLVSVPGTGRERNIVWDAGDVLEELSKAKVDLVLNGHKHVPYVWNMNGMQIITSGTVGTRRTRGLAEPSYNIIEISEEEIKIKIKTPGKIADLINIKR